MSKLSEYARRPAVITSNPIITNKTNPKSCLKRPESETRDCCKSNPTKMAVQYSSEEPKNRRRPMFTRRRRSSSSRRNKQDERMKESIAHNGKNAGGDRQHSKEEWRFDQKKESSTPNMLKNIEIEEIEAQALTNPKLFLAPKSSSHRRPYSKKKLGEPTLKENTLNRIFCPLASGTKKSSNSNTLNYEDDIPVKLKPEKLHSKEKAVQHVIEPVQGTGDWVPTMYTPPPNAPSTHYNIATIGRGRFEEDDCSIHSLHGQRSRRKGHQESKSVNWRRAELDEVPHSEISFTDKIKKLYPQAAGDDHRVRGVNRKDEFRSAFEIFDVEGLGCISAKRLRHILTSFGETLSEEEVDDIIRLVDVDGDGQIHSEQFVNNLCASG